uniref:WD repeat domain 3 n=1 Tax=Gadus morhua TaxID=8049 RepID=A0A8C5BQL8_GADMO
MGLTKQYLRYVSSAVFGVIGSQKANIAYVTLRGGEKARHVAVAACEHVFIWDVRKGEKVLILKGIKHEVTYLCPAPDGNHIAVGYEDGAVRIFNLLSGESNVSFNGHKTAVTAMGYDALGARLVTGSRDTDVIVWDVINECGLFRLKGHKDSITQALFLENHNLLVTSSKDSFVKWWDLDTQHCFKTLVGHRSEVWGMVLLDQESRLLTGSADSELRAWDINYLSQEKDEGEPKEKKVKSLLDDDDEAEDEAMDESPEDRILSCKSAGSILREARDRVVSMTMDSKARILACHGNEAVLELFKVLSAKDVEKAMGRKQKKATKKAAKYAPSFIRTNAVIIDFRWVDSVWCTGGELKVALLLQNNTVETYSLKLSDHQATPRATPTPVANKTSRLTLAGHRTDARTLAFSSDNMAVLSASGDTVKVWNRSTLQVVRTMECDYALCSLFVPGDRQIILGTKSGKLQLFDLASGGLMENVAAHEGALWSLALSPDQRGIVTGGADKTVRFWDFELVKGEESEQKRLTVKHTRTLQLGEDVLCVKISPNQRLLAVALLDSTVKVFYMDTLKFFLSLYGHKLPVLCLDISHDSTLIITGSADRNVKIWGLDFGDCHRSLFAHDDSVMFLQFVPKTHLFFTAGKDKKIKQWDADKFVLIQTLEGHHREVWTLAVSPSGDYLVSSSHDKSLRLWDRTREPIILDEEREIVSGLAFSSLGVPGETEGEVAPAAKKTVETVKAAERIMEALELYRSESRKLEEHKYACENAGKQLPLPNPNPILVAFGNVSLLYSLTVCLICNSELEVSLLVLPFPYVPELLTLFNSYLQGNLEVELVCRCLFFLLRIHFGQITSNQMMLSVIDQLKDNTISKIREIRDVLGFNSAALQFLQRELESKEDVMFFADASGRLDEKRKKRRRRERVILTIV